MRKYYDSKGTEIQADMFLRFPSGNVERIYATMDADGNPDLGINASNDAYMQRHGLTEADREFYPLSSIDLYGTEVCKPELGQDITDPVFGM